ncbi:MAG: M20 family metallo-hydrolase [Azospirillaceae bacterium]
MSSTPLAIDSGRLMETFEAMNRIGATAAGGVHRLALSEEDRRARDLLVHWARQSGYAVAVDAIGSVFLRRDGRDGDAPPIVIGSHLDSQPMAGRYDGPAGVLTALEVLRTLDDAGIATARPVEVVDWTNEEGARFAPPLLGSAVFSGALGLDDALAITDADGVVLGDALADIGYAGAEQPGHPIAGYVEVHIEQGRVLERRGASIGIVTGVVGIRDLRITVTGESTHAGPTPLADRRDALVGASEMVLALNRLGLDRGEGARVTVGRFEVPSASHSVVPGRVAFVVDLRHPAQEGVDGLEAEVRETVRAIGEERGLDVTIEPFFSNPARPFHDDVRSAIARAAAAHGLPVHDLPSWAGHDAWNMAPLAPSGMIFIPCRDGVSHNEAEHAEPRHLIDAANVLLGTTLALAGPA